MLEAASEANVPVITPGLLRAFFRGGPRTVAAALKPWPPSFSIVPDDEVGCVEDATTTQQGQGQEHGGHGVWEFGYRRKSSSDCSECTSWACGDCTKNQQAYAKRLGKHHSGEIGQEWRDMA